jgi:hypothetical protein
VLRHRAQGLAAPVQMSDALSRNTSALPEGVEILLANCLAHYLESAVIQCKCGERHIGRSWIAVNRIPTPDKASEVIEELEKLG